MLHVMTILDDTDRRILGVLDRDSRATVHWIAQTLNLARGTVHARIERLRTSDALRLHSVRLEPSALGWPLRAMVTAEAEQEELNHLVADLEKIPQVIECLAIAGSSDLMLEIVARDADDVYIVTQEIMRCRGIRRTSTSIVLRQLVSRRQHQLL